MLKAYSTCVGAGPFAAENAMSEGWNEQLRKAGGEYGAATGRPRRVGPFDCVASRYGLACQGADKIALTKLDVDDDPRAAYLDQVHNGVYIRMAIILALLGIPDPLTGKKSCSAEPLPPGKPSCPPTVENPQWAGILRLIQIPVHPLGTGVGTGTFYAGYSSGMAASFSTRSIRYPTPTWVWIRCGASGHRSSFLRRDAM